MLMMIVKYQEEDYKYDNDDSDDGYNVDCGKIVMMQRR